MGIFNKAGLFMENRGVPKIKSGINSIKLRVQDSFDRNPALASVVVLNLGAIPVVLSILGLKAASLPLAIGSCSTMRNRLAEMKLDMNLPEKIDTKMTTDLVDNIATPFELKMREKIRDMAFDPNDGRIKNPEISGESIEHLVDKHVLFEMLGEINSDPDKTFNPKQFSNDYLHKLASEMKEEYFQGEAITIDDLLKIIKEIEVKPGKNIADSVVDWVEKNKLFEEDKPAIKEDASAKQTSQQSEEGDAFKFGYDDMNKNHQGKK